VAGLLTGIGIGEYLNTKSEELKDLGTMGKIKHVTGNVTGKASNRILDKHTRLRQAKLEATHTDQAAHVAAVSAPVAVVSADPVDGVLLPYGWEAKTTPQGESYFLDHNTNTAHWEHPPHSSER